MSLSDDKNNKKNDRDYRQISLLAAVPAILIAAPAVGFFVGQWADKQLGTDPWMVVLGLLLGFVAAGIEIAGLVKKAQALDKKYDDNGT